MTIGLTWRRTARRIKRLKEGVLTISPDYSDRDPRLFGALHGETAWHAHQGQRVVEYQQTLQTVSDPLLGWTTVDNHDYYVRQFRDMKGAVGVEGMDGSALMDYGRICGTLLAKGHAQ